MNKKTLVCVGVLLGLAMAGSANAGHFSTTVNSLPPVVDPTPLPPLPTPTTPGSNPDPECAAQVAQYQGQDLHAMYGTIDLSNVIHHCWRDIIPTQVGNDVHETFSSTVDTDINAPGIYVGHVQLYGPVSVLIKDYHVGDLGAFQTEMLSMTLSNPVLPGILVRESPTLASTGSTSISSDPSVGAGNVRIGSFFDIFTELSLDGGQNWQAQTNGAARVTLQSNIPEPATLSLFAAGLGLLGLRRRKAA
jgi:hypothetical protein